MMKKLLQQVRHFFAKPFWSDWRTITVIYALLPIVVALQKWDRYNMTYQIYKSVFWNTIHQLPLFDFYPYLHGDCNHYGPVFAYVIAPFALLPDSLGMLLWLVFLTATFYVAVRYIPLERWQKVFMFWFCLHEVLTPLFVEQYDLAMAGVYLLIFACVQRKQPVWAAFFISLNLFIKLYGIMGLAFFFFIEDKKKFVAALLGWSALFFVLPMLISSPEFVVQQYVGWYDSLTLKNADNMFDSSTNTSLLGMVRKVTHCASYSDLWLLVPGVLLFLTPFRRFDQFRHTGFRYAMLAAVTMFVTLFSTGTESYGYIAPMTGFVIWYATAPWQRSRLDLCLLIYAFIFTSLCTSDIFFPRWIWVVWIKPYALKALPTTVVWLKLTWEMNTRDYAEGVGLNYFSTSVTKQATKP